MSAGDQLANDGVPRTAQAETDEYLEHGADEGTHLLSGNGDAAPNKPESPALFEGYSTVYILSIIAIVVIILDVGSALSFAPMQRLLESSICRSYYLEHDPSMVSSDGSVDEKFCKVRQVQTELAMIRGYLSMFDNAPGVFLAIPYGMLADIKGRKFVVILALCGINIDFAWREMVCYFSDVFPIKLVWLGPIFQLIGGGSAAAGSAAFTMIADVVPKDGRSTAFFRITAAALFSFFVGHPAASVLMSIDVWLPMFLANAFLVVGTLCVLILPETLRRKNEAEVGVDGNETQLVEEEYPRKHWAAESLLHKVPKSVRRMFELISRPSVGLLCATFLVTQLGRSSIEFLLQYASEKFSWSLARANFLATLHSAVNFVLLLAILPYVSSIMSSHLHLRAETKDLWIARAGLVTTAIGLFLIGFAPSPPLLIAAIVIFALGQGYPGAVRSLATSFVEPDEIGRLYAILGTLTMLGAALAGPALSASLGWGLQLGEPWKGMPFILAGGLFVIMSIPLWIFRLQASL